MFIASTSALVGEGREMARHLAFGLSGEEYAANWLVKEGYIILERRFRCQMGEIDIIARLGRVIIFIEVKARRSTEYGSPAEAVTWGKQRKLLRTAQLWLQQKGLTEAVCRMDVIEILQQEEAPKIHHIPNAFGM